MREMLEIVLLVVYFVPALILMAFGLNLYLMVLLFARRRHRLRKRVDSLMREFESNFRTEDLPTVVTQIPVYNEATVVERAMRAAAAMEYPRGLHIVQVLDDSNDETREIVDRVAAELRAANRDVRVLRRAQRTGFKAGALEAGMRAVDAQFFAIFDADFVPPVDFLMRTVPILLVRDEIGLVQARWGHLNANSSLVTRAQGVGIDGHFSIEQPARAWNRLFMNFNGTAGLWRRRAIEEAGGWQHDTLTEDMDLSYRSQLEGWKPFYLIDLVVPAEIPEDINAFKSQQFRWAKGSIQTAIKLMPRVWASPFPLFAKVQAFLHMTHYASHVLMLWMALLALPVLAFTSFALSKLAVAFLLLFVIGSTLAPTALYAVSQCCLYDGGWRRLRYLPMLMSIGVGIAISNSRAVIEALVGKPSSFVRTPKRGESSRRRYSVGASVLPGIELAVGIYCFLSLIYYLDAHRYFLGPFLLIYACGFTLVGGLSLLHRLESLRPLNRA